MGNDDTVPTFGVEEEFLLVDPRSGAPAPVSSQVLDRAGRLGPVAPGATMHPELLSTQVEAATGICADLSELRAQLCAARTRLATAARAEGARLLSVGSPVFAGPPPPPAPGERYARITTAYAGVVADYQTCGCHVHVCVPDREVAVTVVNRLRPWLPTLLALSGNSPFDRGRDTGCQSWRTVLQARFPASGIPPRWDGAADYDQRLHALITCGVLMDEHMTFWMARPSSHLPTVEIRAADALLTVDEAVLQAALTRAMVFTAMREHADSQPEPRVQETTAAAALWAAARHGVTGPGVDPVHERCVPATTLLRDLLTWIEPVLKEWGDLDQVRDLLAGVMSGGNGAEAQRRAGALWGHRSMLRILAERTLSPSGRTAS